MRLVQQLGPNESNRVPQFFVFLAQLVYCHYFICRDISKRNQNLHLMIGLVTGICLFTPPPPPSPPLGSTESLSPCTIPRVLSLLPLTPPSCTDSVPQFLIHRQVIVNTHEIQGMVRILCHFLVNMYVEYQLLMWCYIL